MLITDPYNTSVGSFIPTTKLREVLVKFVTLNSRNGLSYEYLPKEKNVDIMFITGKTANEQLIPIFDHPIVIEDVNKNKFVVTDVRKYIRKVREDENMVTLSSVAKVGPGLDFVILRTLLTAEVADGGIGTFRPIFSNIITAYSSLVSNLITMGVMLDPVEKVRVEIVSAMYLTAMMSPVGINAVDPVLISKYRYSLPINKKTVEVIYNLVKDVEVVDVYSLVEMIKLVIIDTKGSIISGGLITNLVAGLWFGPGASETMSMFNEHIPTTIAMVYIGYVDKSYRKSKLSTLLNKDSKRSKLNEVEKKIEIYKKDTFLNR